MAMHPESGYRSASTLALCAAVVFVAEAVITTLAAFSTATQITLLDAVRFGEAISPGLVEAVDSRQRLFAALQVGGWALGLALFFMWVYRANRNARALGAEEMRYTPASSVGWFFIPLANLFMPYLALREIWKASSPSRRTQWRRARVSPIFGAWWAVGVAQGTLEGGPFPTLVGEQTLGKLMSFSFNNLVMDSLWKYSWGLLIWDVVTVTWMVLTLIVLLSITGLQERKQGLIADLPAPEPAAVV
jgi:hypothetical protein